MHPEGTGEQSSADADLGYFKYPEYYSESVICMGVPLGCCRFGNCNDAGTYVQYGYSAGKTENPQLEIQLRKYFTIRPDWDEIKRILRIGVPSGVENSMFQFESLRSSRLYR